MSARPRLSVAHRIWFVSTLVSYVLFLMLMPPFGFDGQGVASHADIGHPRPHKSSKHRLVTAPASGKDHNFPCDRRVLPRDRLDAGNLPQILWKGQHKPLERFRGHSSRIVNQLFQDWHTKPMTSL